MGHGREVTLTTCVYCEMTTAEVLASGEAKTEEDALKFVVVGESQVLLCPDCRQKYTAHFDDDLDELLNGPITFPPGVTSVVHCCPELEFQGASEDDATSTLAMERRGDYYVATCPHCQVTIRSLAEDEEL